MGRICRNRSPTFLKSLLISLKQGIEVWVQHDKRVIAWPKTFACCRGSLADELAGAPAGRVIVSEKRGKTNRNMMMVSDDDSNNQD